MLVQYLRYLERLVVDQSLGESFANRRDVNAIVAAAAPVTASLVLGGILLSLAISFGAGVYSALRPRSLVDRTVMVFVLLGVSVPAFWFGLVLAYFVGFRLGWTPITGYADLFNPPPGQPGGLREWAHHMTLPWITFGFFGIALYVRMIRASVLETLNEDYVRTARAKGAREARVLRAHVLRNALIPVVTMVGIDIGLALGGAFFIEYVFGLPGLGKTAIAAVNSYDLMVTQGIIIFSTVMIVAFNLVVDILYASLDPRIRLS